MPKIYPEEIKQKALELRRQGFTYSEIPKILNYSIPKNTFTSWFKNIQLSELAKEKIFSKMKKSGEVGRLVAWQNRYKKRTDLIEKIYKRVDYETKNINKFTAKLCLAMLYLGEGGKTNEIFRFGNSDPKIIKLFLKLLRISFNIDEKRLRGALQCRADQDTTILEEFWSKTTGIPPTQFYKTKIDIRTIGKPTQKLDYKGVFVVYYSSKTIFLEVKFISDIISSRLDQGP